MHELLFDLIKGLGSRINDLHIDVVLSIDVVSTEDQNRYEHSTTTIFTAIIQYTY